MSESREVVSQAQGRTTMDGAGVRLKRIFGFHDTPKYDPFLLLDAFGSDDPAQYRAGFPWHPHRGIETITYVLAGDVEHGDSLGNKGVIGTGDVQWMTAGSGIVHQEMPLGDDTGRMWGFQLWANLPAKAKMMPPRYRELKAADIPEVPLGDGVRVKVICGEVNGVTGPVEDIVIEPEYLDVRLDPAARFEHPTPRGHNVFAYLFEGQARFGAEGELLTSDRLVHFGDGDRLEVEAGPEGGRFLLVSGRPLEEPIAWRGPIVMNTDAELDLAFEEYREGTFVR